MIKAKFFESIKKNKLSVTQKNIPGYDTVLDEGVRRKVPLNYLAYILATAYWETAKTMKPIAEYGKGKGRKYGVKDPKTGEVYYGRGYVQLTWKYNYEKAGKKLGTDFVNHPDLVMLPEHAVKILFDGMFEGWFTGKKLADYINEVDDTDGVDGAEYEGARKIINGVDKKKEISALALKFEDALKLADYGPKKSLWKSNTLRGGSLALLAPVADGAQDLASQVEPLIQYSDYIKYLFLGLSLVGVFMVFRARIQADK